MKLILPAALEAEIARQAAAAFPRECCGLIEGARVDDDFRATRIHPGHNLAEAADRFRAAGVAAAIVTCGFAVHAP